MECNAVGNHRLGSVQRMNERVWDAFRVYLYYIFRERGGGQNLTRDSRYSFMGYELLCCITQFGRAGRSIGTNFFTVSFTNTERRCSVDLLLDLDSRYNFLGIKNRLFGQPFRILS